MTQKIQIGIVGLIAFFAFHGLFGQLQNTRPEGLKNVGLDQKLNSQVPMDLEFSDSTGRSVLLGDLFNERPVILTLVYYECPMLCTMVLNGTLKAIRTLEFTVGEDFDIVTVSIDPGETPGLAAEKKAQYLDSYRRESGSRGWYFLTGEEDQIRQLADSVGFRYEYNEETDQFAHASGIMVLTPQGRVARYFYGIDYSPRDLRLGLVEAASEKIASPVDQLLLFCYHYDPSTGKYSLAIFNLLRVAGVLTLIGIGWLIFYLVRKERREGAVAQT